MSTTSRCILPALACSCGLILLLVSGLADGAQAARSCAKLTVGTNAGDELTGTGLRELLRGRGGVDVIRGRDGSDCLFGGADGDLIRADHGRDRVRGGRGNDRVYARDGRRDVIRCGPGRDRAAVDLRDVVRNKNHCEQLSRRKASGSPDPEPGPDSIPPGMGAIPGTGAVIAEDLATNPDPVPLWKQLNSGPSNGVSFSATGGDTHPTIDGSVHQGYRRVTIQDGDQGPGDTTQERLQVGKRDRAAPYNDTFFKFQAGQSVVMYFSFRLQPTPIAFPPPPKDYTQMWQIIHDVSCGQTPRLFMNETPDGVELNVHPYGGGPNNVIWQEDVARGAWHRLAIRLEMSTSDSQGKIQVWGDVNQSGELTQLSPMISTATLYGGACGDKADLFFGRYQHASVPGSYVDFANWQIAEWAR